jgi:class 3 adenylate cyclase
MDAPGSIGTPAEERKLVTALFCDLVGSTVLGERLEAEVYQRVQRAYFDRMRSVVDSHQGTIELPSSRRGFRHTAPSRCR